MDITLDDGIVIAYGTPMLRRVVDGADALNAGLANILAEAERAHPEFRTGRRNHSNQGGWRSKADLLDWPHPEIAALKGEFEKSIMRVMEVAVGGDPNRRVVADLSGAAWVNINRDGDYNVPHNHPGNHWSAVYYVALGEPDPSIQWNGNLEFYDPRGGATAMPVPGFNFGYSQALAPVAGMMIVFPSWLLHSVHPFRGAGTRISIAYNAVVRNFRIEG